MTARPNLPHTSLEAYRASEPVRITHANMIAAALDAAGECGLTAAECAAALDYRLDSVQVNRVMAGLERSGIAERRIDDSILHSFDYICRKNSKGRIMAVWYKVKIPYG